MSTYVAFKQRKFLLPLHPILQLQHFFSQNRNNSETEQITVPCKCNTSEETDKQMANQNKVKTKLHHSTCEDDAGNNVTTKNIAVMSATHHHHIELYNVRKKYIKTIHYSTKLRHKAGSCSSDKLHIAWGREIARMTAVR